MQKKRRYTRITSWVRDETGRIVPKLSSWQGPDGKTVKGPLAQELERRYQEKHHGSGTT